jgi:hypothetical protein
MKNLDDTDVFSVKDVWSLGLFVDNDLYGLC